MREIKWTVIYTVTSRTGIVHDVSYFVYATTILGAIAKAVENGAVTIGQLVSVTG